MDRGRDRSYQINDSNFNLSPKLVFGVIIPLLIFVGLIVSIALTGTTTVEPGEVGVIVNNVTGSKTLKRENGLVIHLPFGLTKVYKVDKTQQAVRMNYVSFGNDKSVQIKTNDGSNVNMDVELQYQIGPEQAIMIVQEIGRGEKYKQSLVRAYARSVIRDELGKLSVGEIADPDNRNGKLAEAKRLMNHQMSRYGITVLLVNATSPRFNEKYELMIKDRKEADQDVINQQSAQLTKKEEQERRKAAAVRNKDVEFRKAQGEMDAKVIAAKENAKQVIARADGDSYAVVKEGEQKLVASENDAKAIEYEGLAKAKSIEALSAAYEKGGLSLVREAVAKKFHGAVLEGKPYSLSTNIERLSIEDKAAAATQSGRAK